MGTRCLLASLWDALSRRRLHSQTLREGGHRFRISFLPLTAPWPRRGGRSHPAPHASRGSRRCLPRGQESDVHWNLTEDLTGSRRFFWHFPTNIYILRASCISVNKGSYGTGSFLGWGNGGCWVGAGLGLQDQQGCCSLSSFGDPAQVLDGPTSRKMLKHWDEQEENQPRPSGMPSLHFCCAKKKAG